MLLKRNVVYIIKIHKLLNTPQAVTCFHNDCYLFRHSQRQAKAFNHENEHSCSTNKERLVGDDIAATMRCNLYQSNI